MVLVKTQSRTQQTLNLMIVPPIKTAEFLVSNMAAINEPVHESQRLVNGRR